MAIDNKANIMYLIINKTQVSTDDIYNYFKSFDANIKRATINWRIYDWVKKGVLIRVGRGVFKQGETNSFKIVLSDKANKLGKYLKKQFPYIDYCVWENSVINQFAHYLTTTNNIFIDVESEAKESVILFLKEKYTHVYDIKEIRYKIEDYTNAIIVRKLVTASPLEKYNDINVPTIEKIIVDIAIDKEFIYYQKNNIHSILETVLNSYTINENKLLRYSSRKGKKDKIKEILHANIYKINNNSNNCKHDN